ncbi:MAG TPA: cyclic nucleotide-binding domain-containing protein [Candidatus Acidoferrum sp.]|nr:cyclic nucleotide-binding domain-containing protein [Candidatus Acidoferrum sp.]
MRKALYLMGILDDGDVEWLGKNGATKYVPSGTVLIHEGSPIEHIYVVLDGKLSVLVKAVGKREIASLLAGEIVGEISFVDSRPPSASVIAAQDSHLLVIPRSTLTSKLNNDNAFASRFYKAVATLLADRLRKTVSYLGYGKWSEDADPDELDEPLMDSVSLGATRFDRLLKRLRIN